MKKTIEEMRAAVLAELQRICPESVQDQERVQLPSEKLYVSRINPQEYGKKWWIGVYSWRNCIVAIGEHSSDHEFTVAYIALGLETRDAVEAERAQAAFWERKFNEECEAHIDSIEQAEARDAKLVEALEEIRNDTPSSSSMQVAQWQKLRTIASSALAAHKEGGVQG